MITLFSFFTYCRAIHAGHVVVETTFIDVCIHCFGQLRRYESRWFYFCIISTYCWRSNEKYFNQIFHKRIMISCRRYSIQCAWSCIRNLWWLYVVYIWFKTLNIPTSQWTKQTWYFIYTFPVPLWKRLWGGEGYYTACILLEFIF